MSGFRLRARALLILILGKLVILEQTQARALCT
jgi:hypothetical protein